jgi:hypothetical protein
MYSYDRRQAARPIPVDKAQARKLAQRIVKELPDQLRFRAEDMKYPINRARGYRPGWVMPVGTYFIPQDVMGHQVEVPVRVQFQALEGHGRQWVAGGAVTTRFYGRNPGDKLALNLYVNSAAVTQELLDHLGEVEDELFSVIIHEATHLSDLLRHEYSGDDEAGTDKYYNAPTEVRAFMQQMADELLREADRLGKDGGAWLLGPEPTGDMIANLLERSSTWERIRRQLTPASTKTILRGVTRALQDEWPSLLKKYPD